VSSSLSSSGLSSQAKIHVMFDGGSRGNPGIAGCGAFVTTTLWDDYETLDTPPPPAGSRRPATSSTMKVAQRHVVKARHYVGPKSTNNEAEYNGLCTGLCMAYEQVQDLLLNKNNKNNDALNDNAHASGLQRLQLIVEGDSQLIIRQLTGVYACKHEKLKPLFAAAQTYVQEMQNLVLQQQSNDQKKKKKRKNGHHPQSSILQVQYHHVLREGNSVADGACRISIIAI
jgi:ribonuclease HI